MCFLVGACDSSTGPEEAHVGTYRLQTVGGEPLPAVVDERWGSKIEILAMTTQLKSGGRFESSGTFRHTDGGVVTTETETATGTYTIRDTLLTFVHDGYTFTGTLVGETMTLTDPGGDFVLLKV